MLTSGDDEIGTSGMERSREGERKQPEEEPRQELVPHAELEGELSVADDPESLDLLLHKSAVAQTLARRMKMALEKQNRLAEFRIRVARKLGVVLRESVRRGGKSKRHDVTSTWGGSSSPLPEGITKKQSSRLQEIARISEEYFERFVQETRGRQESMTVAGLLRAAQRYAAGPADIRSQKASVRAYWEGVWDSATRVMDLDLCVGISARKLGAAASLPPKTAIESQLSGNILVRAGKNVGPWFEKLAEGKQRRSIVEAMTLFVPYTGQPWFRLVESGGWVCCFMERPAGTSRTYAMAYLGERRDSFWTVFRELGVVLGPLEF